TTLRVTVSGLPPNGATVYVSLFCRFNADWQFNDYTYTASGTSAATAGQMTAPAAGSTLTASTVQFQWTGGTGVSDYWLYVGTTPGSDNLYDQDRGMNLSATVTGLPTN